MTPTSPCKSRSRRGTATIEFAVCLPLLVLLVFGAMEACNVIWLKQALTEAAYQGAVSATKVGADESAIANSVQTMLAARNISGGSVVLAGGNFASVSSGDNFTIDVAAPVPSTNMLNILSMSNTSIHSTVTAMKQ